MYTRTSGLLLMGVIKWYNINNNKFKKKFFFLILWIWNHTAKNAKIKHPRKFVPIQYIMVFEPRYGKYACT